MGGMSGFWLCICGGGDRKESLAFPRVDAGAAGHFVNKRPDESLNTVIS